MEAVLAELPNRPAVYKISLHTGDPYLGRTHVLRRRLRRLVTQRLASSAARIEAWWTGSQLDALLTLYALARRAFPASYRRRIRLRMPAYIKLILSNPFPRTVVTASLGRSPAVYYGPFRSRAAAERMEGEALGLFQIRRCADDLEPRPDHPGCIYGEMNLCLRPCQQAVSIDEYRHEADRVAEFFRSGGRSALDSAVDARERSSAEMLFEEAAREHKRIEKIEGVLGLRDALAADIGRLHGVAITRAPGDGAADLRFVHGGTWQPPIRFETAGGTGVSMDSRLREAAEGPWTEAHPRERQEHLALLARWFYSSWRDGEWIPFDSFDAIPYRKLVRAVSRVVRG